MPPFILPLDPKPSHYDVTLQPNMVDFTFTGDIKINLHATAPTTTIVFNTIELAYVSGSVTAADGEQMFGGDAVVLDEATERGSITLPKAVQGAVVLALKFTGLVNDKMHGFYRSSYQLRGETAFMGTTQFEAVDCRRALPCWDEPAVKASFAVTLIVQKHLTTLSNMPEKSRTAAGGDLEAVAFDDTPVMSTYLLAWTIAELDVIETTIPKTHDPTKTTLIRIFAAEGKVEQGRFALDVAAKTLPLYEKFFGSDYILPKCDLLAIPDFAAGAMENWGLITYRETALLASEATSAAKALERVALVVTHELAHQWFGNLVTMQWWKELWLNESFATWIEYWATDIIFPEWEIFTSFLQDETAAALSLDSLLNSHPIEVEIEHAAEVDAIFDAISYCKGGTVLRMVVEYIGLDAFSKGLTAYLKHFEFGNADTKALWKFLGDAAGKDLQPVLAAWTAEQGFPAFAVSQPTATTLRIEQHRFLAAATPITAEQDKTVWQVPMLIQVGQASGATETIRTVLTERVATVAVPEGAWYKVNAQQAVFCRVRYEGGLLEKLHQPIEARVMANVDRFGLMVDGTAFAVNGQSSTAAAMQLATHYVGEEDATVWGSVTGLDGTIRGLLRDATDAEKDKLNAWFAKLYATIAGKLGFLPKVSDTHRDKRLRGSILHAMRAAKDPAAIAACQSLWDNRATTPIPADLRGTVYASVVRTQGAEGWDAIVATYEAATESAERNRCTQALAATEDVAIMQKTIDFALSDKVRGQDAMWPIIAVSASPAGGELFLNLLTQQWATLWDKFPATIMNYFLKSTSSFADEAVAVRVEAFLKTIPEAQYMAVQRCAQQGCEGIRVKAAWLARDKAGILAFVGA
jgi:aminopeptidase N